MCRSSHFAQEIGTKTRSVVLGETLKTKIFFRWLTYHIGFVSPEDTSCVVCVLPDTKLEVTHVPWYRHPLKQLFGRIIQPRDFMIFTVRDHIDQVFVSNLSNYMDLRDLGFGYEFKVVQIPSAKEEQATIQAPQFMQPERFAEDTKPLFEPPFRNREDELVGVS